MNDGTITVQKGDDASISLVLTNSDGSAYSATGSTLTFTVRKAAGVTPVITKTVNTFTGTGHNLATIALSDTDLALDVRAWRWEVALVDGSGNRKTSGLNAFYVTENNGASSSVGVVVGDNTINLTVSVTQVVPTAGIPLGGTTSQVLAKASNADNDTEWDTLATVARSGSYADLTNTPSQPTFPLSVANGGTGSATQNFVDLTTAQTISGNKSFSSGAVNLTNPTSNFLMYPSAGIAAPTFTTRSVGTKIVLYPGVTGVATDYAIGVSSNSLWNSVPGTASQFQWFGATSLAATLSGTGSLATVGSITAGSDLGSLYMHEYNIIRAMPTTVGDEIDIGTVGFTTGAGTIELDVGVNASSFSVGKKYVVPIQYANVATGWQQLVPIADSGPYSATGDFAIDINITTTVVLLRIRRTVGAVPGNLTGTMKLTGIGYSFTPSTATSTVTAPTSSYKTTNISQYNNFVGLGSVLSAPTHTLTLSSDATGAVYYNTADQVTNYERIHQYWNASSFYITPEKGGTGALRPIIIGISSNKYTFDPNASGGAYNVITYGSAGGVGALAVTGTNVQASTNQTGFVQITPTYNQTGTSGATDLLINRTQTAVGTGAQLLADFQVGGVSRHSVDNQGNLSMADLASGGNIIVGTTNGTVIGTATTQKLGFFGATPVVQQSGTNDLGTILLNLGLRAAGSYTLGTSGQVQFAGALRIGVNATAITANTTLTAGSSTPVQDVNATSAAINITPPATTTSGWQYTVTKVDSSVNLVTLVGTFNGTVNPTLQTQWKYMTFVTTTTSGTFRILSNN